MDEHVASLFARVRDRVGADELERRIEAARTEFGGLLDDDALLLLVLDEMGLNEGAYVALAELAGRADATVRARIERIDPPRTFERPGRDNGRVANVHVSDATGEGRLVLWDKDVDRLDEGELRVGAHVTVVNARVKKGPYGDELHVGPWTRLEIEGALDPARRKLLADVADTPPTRASATRELPTQVEGALAWLGPTRPYKRADGATGFTCELDVETADGNVRVVAWDERVRDARALTPGARVRIAPVEPKVKGATTEFHAGADARVTLL